MKIIFALYPVVALFIAVPNPILDWSKRTRAIIILLLAIVALLFVVEALYQFYKRRLARLRLKHKSTVEKLNERHETKARELRAEAQNAWDNHWKELDRLAGEHQNEIDKLKTDHKSEIRDLKEQHKSEQSKLIEGQVTANLALMKVHEKEVEGNKKIFRSIYEGQLKLEKDNRRRNNILRSTLLHKIREQASQLEELKKLKLIVNTYHQSEIRIEQSEESFSITAYLRIHLENNAQYPIRVKSVRAAIFRKTKRGLDKKIWKSEALILPIVSSEQLDNLEFKAGVITPPTWLIGTIDISPRCGKQLNPNCFLRVTMEALTQPPYTVDLDVNWELARIRANNSPVYLIPRRSALYQAHK